MLEANSLEGRRIRREFKESLPKILAGRDHFISTPFANLDHDLPNIPLETIFRLVCEETGFTQSQLRSVRKRRSLACARFLFYLLAERYSKASQTEFAQWLNRDVSSVCHGLKRADEIYRRDLYRFRHHYQRIEAQLDTL